MIAWAGVVLMVLAWLLRLAWPSLLPPGGGSDLTHHLLLVDYIERARHLVHDRSLEGAMGEMAHYTPGAVVAGIHSTRRLGWALLVRTSGAVLTPTLLTAGWVFPLLAALGLASSLANPRARVTLALLLAIAVQAVTLFFMSSAIGADTPYMAYKMGYLAIYPLAIFGALAIHAVFSRSAAPIRSAAGWAIATLMMITIVRPAITAPRQAPVVSLDLYDAGRWMRANVGPACADYLVEGADTAYWLHLAVLGNPRSSARTAEIDHYNARAEIGRWVAGLGQGHAVADLGLLPDEVRSRVEVMAQFGSAAVVRRAGAAGCQAP